MNKEYIEFKKQRDLGSVITDTFKFIRLEGKQFFSTIFKMIAIPLLIVVLAFVYFFVSTSNLQTDTSVFNFAGMGISGLVLALAYIVLLVYINLVGMYYIKSYIDNKGVVNKQEIELNTRQKFWSFTGFGIVAMIILIVSVVLCFFPVFYTATALSLGASLLVFNNDSAMDAIGNSFTFITGYFWETFGVVFVVGLLLGVLGYIFQIPALIYQIVKIGVGFGSDGSTQILGLYSDPIYIILNVVSIIGKLLFYVITLVSNVFIFFDINEQKNLSGTIEKIDSIGS